jgi:hypothetical protein
MRISPGFNLRARYIIHAVGPVWRGGAQGEAELLASCYRRSVEAAREFESLAYCCFSETSAEMLRAARCMDPPDNDFHIRPPAQFGIPRATRHRRLPALSLSFRTN